MSFKVRRILYIRLFCCSVKNSFIKLKFYMLQKTIVYKIKGGNIVK